ncbi:hypothetical protein [Thermoflexus sp.]|uniref:hypothetical protein n=1 Tax=Thermoflexus sp. TaxID=1969742 RepID=UPI0026009B7C|nr:hypothetical protein [Thermoflexus sp.]MDW8064392.1 hypothetical protein [Anaerolineae bacterium]MCS6963854.1 hypothetical protein [Thermoflexus sp.]MCS7350248.1 hypothetical protein [Thermoflexus sp.]MDW8065767.1 hypothetical protein [Anaerolineae bacterium]MDW8179699.1 hypothetical protein [Anaerolineae bacterium]
MQARIPERKGLRAANTAGGGPASLEAALPYGLCKTICSEDPGGWKRIGYERFNALIWKAAAEWEETYGA